MAESRLAAVLRVLDGLSERSAGQFVACCPAHPDSTPSLSVAQGDGGRLLLHCLAGCEYPAIRDALLACGVDPAVFRVGTPGRGAVVAEYAYTDEDGTVLYVKTRLEPKDFRLKAPDGAGGWIHSQVLRHAPRRVLYRLPEVKAAIRAGRPVYVVEGEKDADTLATLGLTATCNVEGAAAAGQRAKWLPAYGEQLAGARTVIVVADKDRPGYAHAQSVARSLAGKVTAVRTVIAAAGKDVTDHVTAGFGVDQLIGVDADAALADAPADPAEQISYDVNEYWESSRSPARTR